MEWVHCNFCYQRPGAEKFFMTNCGHVFCQACCKKWENNTCPVCKERYSMVELSNKDMKPEIRIYFSNPSNIIAKMVKEVAEIPLGKVIQYEESMGKQLSKVLKFQWEHMLRYFNYYKSFSKKAMSEIQLYKKNFEVIKAELNYYRKLHASTSQQEDFANAIAPTSSENLLVGSFEVDAEFPLVKKRICESQSSQQPLANITNSLQSFNILTPAQNQKENIYIDTPMSLFKTPVNTTQNECPASIKQGGYHSMSTPANRAIPPYNAHNSTKSGDFSGTCRTLNSECSDNSEASEVSMKMRMFNSNAPRNMANKASRNPIYERLMQLSDLKQKPK